MSDTKRLYGKELIWRGKTDKINLENFLTNIRNEFEVKQNETIVRVSLKYELHTKEIVLAANKIEPIDKLEFMLFDLLKFENLFEGKFYDTKELFLDKKDIMYIVYSEWNSYYKSTRKYTYISKRAYSDCEYKKLFLNWRKLVKELDIVHQMFLYSSYSSDMTVDIRLALMLQTFEPITERLIEENKMMIGKKNKHFRDRIQKVIQNYGETIFDNDNTDLLIRRAVGIRNRVVHLNNKKQNFLSGEESGVYIYKFSLIYRKVILSMLGIDYSIYKDDIKRWVESFEEKYGDFMIKKDAEKNIQ